MITVEDFNSVLKEYGGFSIYHTIDTGLITEDYDYDDITYDFCKVSRETTGDNEYTFQFEVVNGAWTGGYWITDNNDEWLDVTGSYNSNTGVITIITNEPSIKLYLYICAIPSNFIFEKLQWIIISPTTLYLMHTYDNVAGVKLTEILVKLLNPNYDLSYIRLSSENDKRDYVTSSITATPAENVYSIVPNGLPNNKDIWQIYYDRGSENRMYLKRELVNSHYLFKINQNKLILGKINHLSFTKDDSRHVSAGELSFNDESIPFYFRNGVDLDLRKYEKDKVNFKIKLYPTGNDYFWGDIREFSLIAEYLSIQTNENLVLECGSGGASIFKLGANLTLVSDLTIAHDVKILGEDCTIDLNGHSIIVDEGVKLDLYNCSLVNGDNAIVQKSDSTVDLTGVTFTNCVSSEYSNLGSCIYCDIDLDSLSVEDDFKTTLTDCNFFNNQSAILSGGTLVLDGCKLHNTDLTYLDKHNVALLYQTDGNATIRNSIFDIDYTATTLCENEESIGFAQCLFRLGTSARLNNHSYTDIKDNGIEITRNACHIFVKYYYPALEECVFTSPILDKEDSAFCYALTGLNKIFKHNVQITKASDNTENTYRKIEW